MNNFEKERLRFQPLLPQALRELEALEPIEKGRIQLDASIQTLFPHTCHQPVVQFKRGVARRAPLKVGVVLSGGQAAGGHNVIIGLFDALKKIHSQARLFGFLAGPSGILDNRYRELDRQFLSSYLNTGGFDMIGSGRTKIETPEQFESALRNCKSLDLDGLVIIGGDDSNTNAALLAEYFLTHECKTHVIGVPKTIDGDLKNEYVETSFGFDTACKIYSELIGNICRDAVSAKKYTHFIRLMGRSASHIALECALQTHPNVTLIAEEVAAKKMTLKQITEIICICLSKRSEAKRNYAVIVIPEGLIEFIPEMKTLIRELNSLLAQDEKNAVEKLSKQAHETFSYLPKEIAEQLLMDRDPHGNVQVSHIATEQLLIHTVKNALKNHSTFQGKFAPVGHFFGYEGRCGYPSNFDANYCYALGATAAVLVSHGLSGYMSVVQKLAEPVENWIPAGIPLTLMMTLEERKGRQKPVIKKALVELDKDPYKLLQEHRDEWSIQDCYQYPPPTQFFGPPHICNETTYTLKLQQHSLV